MRVIAGKYKRKLLVSTPGQDTTRPTSDRVKESLFNILQPHLQDAVVLDLFAGSGALGIEALSRGARKVIFIEHDTAAITALRKNITTVGIPTSQAIILNLKVEEFLEKPFRYLNQASPTEDFAASADLVIADPPYGSEWYDSAITQIESSQLCHANCIVTLEMSQLKTLPEKMQNWHRFNERKYGKTRLEFWEKQIEGD